MRKHDFHLSHHLDDKASLAPTEWQMLHPPKDKTREELDKLLHTDNVISMRLFCIEFDSELLFAAACLIWLRSVTRLEYVIDPSLFPH